MPLDFERHPYLMGIYGDEAAEIVAQKSSQMGLSEWAITDAFWALDTQGANVLYLLPTVDDVRDFSTARIGPAIEASPYISRLVRDVSDREAHRQASDRQTLKRVRNRFLYLRHATVKPDGSAHQLKAAAIDVLTCDELDEMDPRAPAIAEKRLRHSHLAWRRVISTPTLPEFGVNAALLTSDHRVWKVRCPHCNRRQTLDPFAQLITEMDGADRPAAWHHRRGDPEAPFLACVKCGKALDPSRKGEWIAMYPGRPVHGYALNRLMDPAADLMALIRAGQTYDPSRQREWRNQDLGLPYQPAGGSYSDGLLQAVQTSYGWPQHSERTAMGIDVGGALHVVVRRFRRDPSSGKVTRRLVHAGTVENFEDIDALWETYGVRQAIVDAQPETREAAKFCERHRGRAKMAWYVQGRQGLKRDEPVREKESEEYALDLDRTRTLDALWAMYRAGPKDGGVENTVLLVGDVPDFGKHLKAMRRVTERDTDGNLRARWVSTGADHFGHADNYCNVALDMMGEVAEGEGAVLTTPQPAAGRQRRGRESSWR